MTAPTAPHARPRNPGPLWGIWFMGLCDRVVPELIYRPLRALGTWIAVAVMPSQRRASREYLSHILPRPPSVWNVFRHFFTFEEAMMVKLRIANGQDHETRFAPGMEEFQAFLESGRDGMLGSFHVGDSDLMGFLVGPRKGHRIYMVRQRVENSHETEALGSMFGNWLTFIWVNQTDNVLFALKDAIASGGSVAMHCDRLGFSAKTEAFEFLGARRLFPFTIYHLALIFGLPVVMSVGIPGTDGVSYLHSSPVWEPDQQIDKAANLGRARVHFQAFLRQLETLLREHPYLWFNFLPLNPVVKEAGNAGSENSPRPTFSSTS